MTASPGTRLTNLRLTRLIAMIALLAIVAAACASDEAAVDEPTEDDAAAVDEPTEEEATEEAEPTEDAATESAEATEEEPSEDAGEPLQMAYLLPQTGQLAFLGPPIIAGFELAIEEINAAGGVNGSEVAVDGGDEGADSTTAGATVDRLLADGTDIIIGAASSARSLDVLDTVVGAGVAMCSPSNTSASFTSFPDNGLYFRAAPPDGLQGQVLAEQLISAGGSNIALLARADDYGQGFLDATVAELEAAGASIALAQTYDFNAGTFDAEIEQVVSSGADAVALISFDEGARILQTMIEAGVGPADIIVFGGDGIASGGTPELVDPNNPGVIEGMFTTSPAPASDDDFNGALTEFAPDVEDTLFAAEGYDCTVAAALAAHAGGANTSDAIAENMVAVTREGTKCTSFAECVELLDAGEDIDYDGPSGPMDFTDDGEPSQGVYSVGQFTADGELEEIDRVEAAF